MGSGVGLKLDDLVAAEFNNNDLSWTHRHNPELFRILTGPVLPAAHCTDTAKTVCEICLALLKAAAQVTMHAMLHAFSCECSVSSYRVLSGFSR